MLYVASKDFSLSLAFRVGSFGSRAVCMMYTPRSRLSILQPSEIDYLVSRSVLVTKYAQTFNRESLQTILSRKIPSKSITSNVSQTIKRTQRQKVKKTSPVPRTSTLEKVLNSATSREIGRTAAQALSRSLFNTIGGNQKRRRKK